MMNVVWVLAIPLWVFAWVSLAVGFFKLVEDRMFSWWVIPAWMSIGVPGLFTMIGGLIVLSSAAATGVLDLSQALPPSLWG